MDTSFVLIFNLTQPYSYERGELASLTGTEVADLNKSGSDVLAVAEVISFTRAEVTGFGKGGSDY